MDIYKQYGWLMFNGKLIRMVNPEISYENIDSDIRSYNTENINENIKLSLLLNTLCQNMFNYGDIHLVNHANFINYLEYAKIPSKLIEIVKYRLGITKSVKRKNLLGYLKKILSSTDYTSYRGLIYKTDILPQMQYIKPVYNEQFRRILKASNLKPVQNNIEVVKSPLKFTPNEWYMVFPKSSGEYLHSFPVLTFLKKNCILTNCLKLPKTTRDFEKTIMVNFLYIVNANIDYTPYFYMAKILGAEIIHVQMNGLSMSEIKRQISASENIGINLKYHKEPANIQISPANIEYNVKNAKPVNIMKNREIRELAPIPNKTNSCYMDTVLFSLLYQQNMPKIISYKLFSDNLSKNECGGQLENLRDYLKKLRAFIFRETDINYCIDFRKLISACETGKRFSSTSEQDVGEFLTFLFDIFKVKGAVMKTVVYGIRNGDPSSEGNNGLKGKTEKTSSFIDKSASLINFTDSFYLSTVDNIKVSDLLRKQILTEGVKFSSDTTGHDYMGKIEINQVLKTLGFYVFYIQRAHIDTVLENTVIPDEQLKIGNETLYLYSVIFHLGILSGGHYLACFLHDNNWYLYDDMKSYFSEIGSYKDLIGKSSIKNRGILFFYKGI
jgi:hypothetical protein